MMNLNQPFIYFTSSLARCMVNRTTNSTVLWGCGASAASPAPKAPAPKAQLLENFAHFQTSRKQARVLDFKVECGSRAPGSLFRLAFCHPAPKEAPLGTAQGTLGVPLAVFGVEKHQQAFKHKP